MTKFSLASAPYQHRCQARFSGVAVDLGWNSLFLQTSI